MLLIELIIFTKTFSYARGTSCLKSTVTLIWSLRSEVEVVLILHLPLFVVCSSVSYQILPMLSLLATIACTQIFGLNLCRKSVSRARKNLSCCSRVPDLCCANWIV